MRERFKTLLLSLLVLSGIAQYFLLIVVGQEPLRVLPQSDDTANKVTLTDSIPPQVLAAPPRMIAHLPTTSDKPKHALLRSGSRYYASIWGMAKGAFTALSVIDAAQFTPVSSELWDAMRPSVELILSQPLPLEVYCDLLGVTLTNGADLMLDRFYLSATEDNCILMSDGSGGIYALPWKLKADVLHAFLVATEGIAYIPVQPLNISYYGLKAAHIIYTQEANNASPWLIAPQLNKTEFIQKAPAVFGDAAMLRVFEDTDSGDAVFEDSTRRLRFTGEVLFLEQTRTGNTQEQDSPDVWQETARTLRLLDLWPDESFAFDGLSDTATRKVVFFQQAKFGRPIFFLDDSEDEARYTSTLRARSRNGELVSLRYRPLRFINTVGNLPAISQEQLLYGFSQQLPNLPGMSRALADETPSEPDAQPLLRDIYEGFLCGAEPDIAQPIWIIEFADGSRYFFDIVSGAYRGYLPAVVDRY